MFNPILRVKCSGEANPHCLEHHDIQPCLPFTKKKTCYIHVIPLIWVLLQNKTVNVYTFYIHVMDDTLQSEIPRDFHDRVMNEERWE